MKTRLLVSTFFASVLLTSALTPAPASAIGNVAEAQDVEPGQANNKNKFKKRLNKKLKKKLKHVRGLQTQVQSGSASIHLKDSTLYHPGPTSKPIPPDAVAAQNECGIDHSPDSKYCGTGPSGSSPAQAGSIQGYPHYPNSAIMVPDQGTKGDVKAVSASIHLRDSTLYHPGPTSKPIPPDAVAAQSGCSNRHSPDSSGCTPGSGSKPFPQNPAAAQGEPYKVHLDDSSIWYPSLGGRQLPVRGPQGDPASALNGCGVTHSPNSSGCTPRPFGPKSGPLVPAPASSSNQHYPGSVLWDAASDIVHLPDSRVFTHASSAYEPETQGGAKAVSTYIHRPDSTQYHPESGPYTPKPTAAQNGCGIIHSPDSAGCMSTHMSNSKYDNVVSDQPQDSNLNNSLNSNVKKKLKKKGRKKLKKFLKKRRN